MSDFNFNAPQYLDFTSTADLELENYGEDYFDMDHENEVIIECEQQSSIDSEIKNETESNISEIKNEIESNISEIKSETEPINSEIKNETESTKAPVLRRSLSAGAILIEKHSPNEEINDLSEKLDALQFSEKKTKKTKIINGINQSILPNKTNFSDSCQSNRSTKSYYRPRAISREALNNIGSAPDKLKRKTSVENLQPSKYISIAEAINKFQFGTPQRFHSQSSKTHFEGNKYAALKYTVPQSPMLATKMRKRANSCVSHEEKELQEAEEIKKHQIKAQPMNYKIFRTPVLPSKADKKSPTKPQPFKFADVQFQKTSQPPKEELYKFHARPAPKSLHTKPVEVKNPLPTTAAKTPTFMKRYKEQLPKVNEHGKSNQVDISTTELHYNGIPKITTKMPQRTKIQPFSFEDRDKRMMQRKEEKIRKFLEEEKKLRDFHANPILSKVTSGSGKIESKVSKLIHGSSSSLNSYTNKNDENREPSSTALFKAKPATVVHKKPFIPKKEPRPLVEISEFNLHSIRRAKEREEFDKKIKEKEEEITNLKKQNDDSLKQTENEEINKLRKDLVHKANPIKKYKPIVIQDSTKKLTSPQTPKFLHKKHN